jgi:coenzyme F420-0:L-glutamate ligase / coenzyme F420-1:gamma-L-glutamate ligase
VSASQTWTDSPSLTATALPGIPLIAEGDDLAAIILAALKRAGLALQNDDALVISSKIVSKAEGRRVDLRTVEPGDEAQRLAEITRKDPRIVELVLRESAQVSRAVPGVLVTQHRLGFVSANAGIDQSNVGESRDDVLLLPLEPDTSAARIRQALATATGVQVGIVLSDSHGRPFRMGNVGVAIGVAGMPALVDLRGQFDLFGRELRVSTQGYADLVASAAHLLCGEGDEGRPVVHIRGLKFTTDDGQASDLNRPHEQDLYR